MLSLICVWINDWVNNRDAGYLRRHRGHYDVTVIYAPFMWYLPPPDSTIYYHEDLDAVYINSRWYYLFPGRHEKRTHPNIWMTGTKVYDIIVLENNNLKTSLILILKMRLKIAILKCVLIITNRLEIFIYRTRELNPRVWMKWKPFAEDTLVLRQ